MKSYFNCKFKNNTSQTDVIHSVYHWKNYHLLLGITAGKVSVCQWITADEASLVPDDALPTHPLMSQLKEKIHEYLNGKLKEFDLPILIEGTDFQRRVWEIISEIPYGSTITYGEIASRLGIKGGAQAVGGATGSNRIAIIIPCHRVVGANGKLTGYAGGIDIKRELLKIEGILPYSGSLL